MWFKSMHLDETQTQTTNMNNDKLIIIYYWPNRIYSSCISITHSDSFLIIHSILVELSREFLVIAPLFSFLLTVHNNDR